MLRPALLLFLLLSACLLLTGREDQDQQIRTLLERTRATTLPAFADVPAPRSLARIRYPPKVCVTRSGATPLIVLRPQSPHVGEPVSFSVVSTWLSPRPETTWFLAIGTRLLPEPYDLAGAGAPGCFLMVAWDTLLIVPAGTDPGTLWRYGGPGQIDFDWTPLSQHAGTHWFVQGAVASGENAAGLLTTPVLELSIGP